MSEVVNDLLYTEEHEWARVEGGVATVGITAYAADQLGDVTYIDLPEEGDEVTQGDAFSEVESIKAVSDVYAPAGGVISAVNERLEGEPGLINQSPYDEGWICRIELCDEADLENLLDAEQYAELLQRLEQAQ